MGAGGDHVTRMASGRAITSPVLAFPKGLLAVPETSSALTQSKPASENPLTSTHAAPLKQTLRNP